MYFFYNNDDDGADKKTMKVVKNHLRRQQKNANPTVIEEQKMKLFCTKGLAAFDCVKNLTNASGLSPKGLQFSAISTITYKCGLFRKRYPRIE